MAELIEAVTAHGNRLTKLEAQHYEHLATKAWVLGRVVGGKGLAAVVAIGVTSASQLVRPDNAGLDSCRPVFGHSISRRLRVAVKAAGIEGQTGDHSGRVGLHRS